MFLYLLLYTTPTYFGHTYRPSSGSDKSRLLVQRILSKHLGVVYNNKYKNTVQIVGDRICI